MIGGPQSFGAGGWQNTEVEKALPVTMDIKSMKVESKSGLVLMMHASEMAEGNAWQRKIAKLAIERLSPMDMLGMIYFDHGPGGGHKWHIPFQVVGGNRGGIMALVNTMQPGDMPDCDPQFVMAYKELTKEEYGLGTKHIIFISDGDHWNANPALLAKVKAAKITCTTVCITTHGQAEVNKMKAVAQATGGRAYHIKNPSELPAIYIKETRLISQSFVHEKRFTPRLVGGQVGEGAIVGLKNPLPDLYGFVRTSKRPTPLVDVPIETPLLGIGKDKHNFPILAYWQYGLGRSMAFTSDARTQREQGKVYWDHDWASADMYTKFWEQVVDYSLRAVDTGQYLKLNTEVRDGKIRLTLEARDDRTKLPITNLLDQDESKNRGLKVGITSPSLKGAGETRTRELRFEQTAGGVYEAEVPAEEIGSYFINVVARWHKDGKDYAQSVRAGVTIPYSPEFAEMESNASLLKKLADATGGNVYPEASLSRVARSGDVFRRVPQSHSTLQTLWPWFVVLAAVCLLCDIAVRRIAIEPSIVWARGTALWERLRGRAVVDEGAAVLERLKSRKQQASEAIAREHAARRFEAEEGVPMAPVASAAATAAPPAQRPTTKPPVSKKEATEDYATRLMKAKKRALEEREKKDKEKQ
jgi:hypothetical protein